jgi:hypothetical protein
MVRTYAPDVTLQPITYRGRTVAAATRSRFFLAEVLDERPACDPERTFVIFMCAYAGDVLAGGLPGPYDDEHARRYARAALVPAELLDRAELDVERTARALRLPPDELRAACAEHAARTIDACFPPDGPPNK